MVAAAGAVRVEADRIDIGIGLGIAVHPVAAEAILVVAQARALALFVVVVPRGVLMLRLALRVKGVVEQQLILLGEQELLPLWVAIGVCHRVRIARGLSGVNDAVEAPVAAGRPAFVLGKHGKRKQADHNGKAENRHRRPDDQRLSALTHFT